MSAMPTTEIVSKKSAVLKGHNSKIQLLCKVIGADKPTDLPKRSALNLALVLDRSGSMSGQPLEEAKKCAIQIVKRLNSEDKVTVISYDDSVKVVTPITAVQDPAKIIQSIQSISSGGMTDLFGGWEAGAKELAAVTVDNGLSRVLILSDGCTNRGLTDTNEIVKRCRNVTDNGITTSTYGLGQGFNEDLMVAMANGGGGNSYYGETAADLEEPFNTEFDLLSSLCAKGLFLDFTSEFPVKLLNTQLIRKEHGYQTDNLPYEGAVWVVFEMEIPSEVTNISAEELLTIGTFNVQYNDMDGMPHTLTQTVSLPIVSASAYGDLVDNPEVQQRITELKASELQIKAKEAAGNYDWAMVDLLLKEVESLGTNNAWVASVAMELQGLARLRDRSMFMKESMYSSSRFQKRHIQAQFRLSEDFSMEAGDDEPSYMSRKSRQGRKR